jgi:5-methylcytosine-specific restriction endonuclease McrA
MADKENGKTRGEKRRKRRGILLEKLGGKCVWCGTTEELTFDHIDKTTKSFVLSGKGLDGDWEKILRELDKCQILCDTCHKKKTIEEDRQSN